MKCFAAVLLLALFAVALAAEIPAEARKTEGVIPEKVEAETTARDKRGVLLGAAYTAPIGYTAYSAPVAYSAAYNVPYAYSAYRAYPYYYNSPYIVG